jgi:hypothetical protein
MSIPMPTRHRASTDFHSAHATPWLKSAPHTLDALDSLLFHTSDAPLNQPPALTAIPLRAQSTAFAHHEQPSIPIRLPR